MFIPTDKIGTFLAEGQTNLQTQGKPCLITTIQITRQRSLKKQATKTTKQKRNRQAGDSKVNRKESGQIPNVGGARERLAWPPMAGDVSI